MFLVLHSIIDASQQLRTISDLRSLLLDLGKSAAVQNVSNYYTAVAF